MKCKVYAKGDKTCKKPNNLQWRVFYAEKDYNQRFGAEIGSFDYDEEAENATPNASASKRKSNATVFSIYVAIDVSFNWSDYIFFLILCFGSRVVGLANFAKEDEE